MKLKIISDGKPFGARVVDEHGNTLEGVTSINLRAGQDGLFKAEIEIENVPVDIEPYESEITTRTVKVRRHITARSTFGTPEGE